MFMKWIKENWKVCLVVLAVVYLIYGGIIRHVCAPKTGNSYGRCIHKYGI